MDGIFEDKFCCTPCISTYNLLSSLLPTEVVIGFDPETYTVDENDGFATLIVRVLSGALGKEVTVDFTTLPGSAIGKSLWCRVHLATVIYYILFSLLLHSSW